MKLYRKYIKRGVAESLSNIPFHSKAPIKRISMLNKKIIPESDMHVAVHFVDSKKDMPNYSELHKHNKDEINLILSDTGNLKYEVQLEDEVYTVSSQSTVFIPKHVRHRARAISGKGIFVCIILSSKYKSS
jgi:mannose-6-phosphate isomerase-like protein (cupin superfamily)|tara:strand:- start:346 stop:738 length:393 start_codon:yes stop_codon:yes gene_type:complete